MDSLCMRNNKPYPQKKWDDVKSFSVPHHLRTILKKKFLLTWYNKVWVKKSFPNIIKTLVYIAKVFFPAPLCTTLKIKLPTFLEIAK